MANRTRRIRREINFSDEEWELIQGKMNLAHTNNFSEFTRKTLLAGYVVYQDFGSLREMTGELGKIGANINQIAKRANETRSIYEDDIRDLQRSFAAVKSYINEQLVKTIRQI